MQVKDGLETERATCCSDHEDALRKIAGILHEAGIEHDRCPTMDELSRLERAEAEVTRLREALEKYK